MNRSLITGFYGAGEEQGDGNRAFSVDADEPPALLGEDRAPNPVEHLLHALAACLTSTIVYKAAARGITIESIESELEGDLDALAFLELADEGRTGYESVRVSFKIRSDAPEETLKNLYGLSPVLDVVRNGTPVSVSIAKV